MLRTRLGRDPVAERTFFTPVMAIDICLLVIRTLEAVSLEGWSLMWESQLSLP